MSCACRSDGRENLADVVNEKLMRFHRGLTLIDDKLVAFGNDGYATDERSRREVDLLRGRLDVLGLEEVAFFTNSPIEEDKLLENSMGLEIAPSRGCTWAMILRDRKGRSFEAIEAKVSDVLWEAWFGKSLDQLDSGEKSFMYCQTAMQI